MEKITIDKLFNKIENETEEFEPLEKTRSKQYRITNTVLTTIHTEIGKITISISKTGLKYMMNVYEEPERDKIMEDAEKEIKESMSQQLAGQIPEVLEKSGG